MKTTFNSVIQHLTSIDEIKLFRAMASSFNAKFVKSTFVKETHSHKGFVDFNSRILGSIKKIEIADLLFINFNKTNKEIRICFLQAKYKKRKYTQFLTFSGNLFQWELLEKKYDIIDTYNIGFPTNILNFTSYQSITSFGIFYHDINGEIDFLYTLPSHICPKSRSKYTTMFFKGPCICPNLNCTAGQMPRETISTCSIDIFEQDVISGKIGAPADSATKPFIFTLIKNMQRNDPNNLVINELIDLIGIQDEHSKEINYSPNAIILISAGENTSKNFG